MAENTYVYIDKLKKNTLPTSIYKIEKDYDLFETWESPSNTFKVITFDLNNDKKSEYFVSNPENNGLYAYFWRIYESDNKEFTPIGEMFCTSIRITSQYTDNYRDIECYSYISLVEGYLGLYKHFGNEYNFNSKQKINSAEYYTDYP